MALRNRGLAGLDLRRSGHAPLHLGGFPIRGPTNRHLDDYRSARWTSQFAHSRRFSVRLGDWRRLFWPNRRSPGPGPRLEPDRVDLRRVYGLVLFRADLVGTADLSLSSGAGHRRRMGGGRVVARRNLAASLASLGRCGLTDG